MRDDVAKSTELPADALERQPTYANSGINLVSYMPSSATMLRLIWNKRQFLLRWMTYGLALSALTAFLIPRRFESAARLMPPDQSNSGVAMLAAAATSRTGSGLGSGLGSIAGDLLGLKSSGELFVGILQSRTVQDDLINKLNLRKVYWDRYLEDARRDLDKNTEISEDRKSGIITIRVTDKNPQRAAALAQEYVSELNRIVISLNTSSAHREREFLEERLAQVKQDLESAEKGFSQFASENTALDIPAQGKAMIEAAAALEGQLIGAQTELESLRQIYADGNVRVRSTQARVNELRHQLQKIGGKFDSTIQPGSQDDQSMYPSIKKLPLLGVKYADLYRNTKVEEAVFETLTQEYELAKVEEEKETLIVKVLDPPNIPEKKSYPPRLLIVILGTLLAMSMSVVWIFGRAFWTEIDSREPHKVLALEISQTTRASLPWGVGNASGNGHPNGWFWNRFFEKRNGADRHD
ncbi:MAG TPA: GNVR domain-containing protein [Verrucomicrobiae bacterium]|nr:GNVR domain-containing protein [Verrucomicrobiae bacterium]